MAAIYMWPEDKQIILTTTLYPVDVTDSLAIEITFTGGSMSPLPESDAAFVLGLQGGILQQEIWYFSDGPYDSDAAFSLGLVGGILQQEIWFFSDGPYDSDAKFRIGMGESGLLIGKLVSIDTPDEKLQLACTIDPCSMMEV
jgi:hypothetical protein